MGETGSVLYRVVKASASTAAELLRKECRYAQGKCERIESANTRRGAGIEMHGVARQKNQRSRLLLLDELWYKQLLHRFGL